MMNELEQAYFDSAFAATYPEHMAAKREAQQPGAPATAAAASTDRVGEIPRNMVERALGGLGEVIQSFAAQAEKVGLKLQLPGFDGELNPTLKDVTVGDLGKVLEDMSYGFYPVKGKGMTAGLKPEAAELLNAAPAAGIGKAVVKRAARAFKYGADGKRLSNF